MNYWLLVADPEVYSWDQLAQAGHKGAALNGLRNDLARKHMLDMKLDDLCFYYHGGAQKRILGIVKIILESHPDVTDDDRYWQSIDVAVLIRLINPVPLDMCRADQRLADMALLSGEDLPVQPVSRAQWEIICEMGGLPRAP